MSAVSFEIAESDRQLVDEIVQRYAAAYSKAMRVEPSKRTLQNLRMDLTATHANGCPMDFAKLLATDNFTFGHDISGIDRHIDRSSGKLLNCFLPRCAKREPWPAADPVAA
jgi:hypothetical protein